LKSSQTFVAIYWLKFGNVSTNSIPPRNQRRYGGFRSKCVSVQRVDETGFTTCMGAPQNCVECYYGRRQPFLSVGLMAQAAWQVIANITALGRNK